MAAGSTLELSLRLERWDDLFTSPSAAPWSANYGDHGAVPALEFIADELAADPSYREAAVVVEVADGAAAERSIDEVRAAIARWSVTRTAAHDRAVRTAARRGLRFLVAGLLFFVVGIGVSRLIGGVDGELADTLSRGFEVFAWVVLWFPLDVLVFGMWQHRLDRRAAEAIGRMSIELVDSNGPTS